MHLSSHLVGQHNLLLRLVSKDLATHDHRPISVCTRATIAMPYILEMITGHQSHDGVNGGPTWSGNTGKSSKELPSKYNDKSCLQMMSEMWVMLGTKIFIMSRKSKRGKSMMRGEISIISPPWALIILFCLRDAYCKSSVRPCRTFAKDQKGLRTCNQLCRKAGSHDFPLETPSRDGTSPQCSGKHCRPHPDPQFTLSQQAPHLLKLTVNKDSVN